MKEITIDDVKSFLGSLNVKLDIYGMVFAERQRCQETMRMLGINEIVAKSIIKNLTATDFSKYILMTPLNGAAIFGRLAKTSMEKKYT